MVQVRFGFSLTEAQTVSDGQDESPHKTTTKYKGVPEGLSPLSDRVCV